jgi:hypothetical protein
LEIVRAASEASEVAVDGHGMIDMIDGVSARSQGNTGLHCPGLALIITAPAMIDLSFAVLFNRATHSLPDARHRIYVSEVRAEKARSFSCVHSV